jgi:hypothetical protein
MAHGVYFVCRGCGREICAWDEGNPYYLDEFGRKRYAYHPDQERDRCTGNDARHLCLDCGAEFPVDSAAHRQVVPLVIRQSSLRHLSCTTSFVPSAKKAYSRAT